MLNAAPQFFERVRRKAGRHGWPAALYSYGMRAVNSAVPTIRILRALYLEEAHPAFRKCPTGFTVGFASRDALHKFADRPEYELSAKFVDDALSHGDQCLAIWDGPLLAAYSWYSFRPTPIGLPGTLLHFDPDWVYMYKGFTLPQYRGHRLYSFGVTLALQRYAARGFSGLVSYVDSWNFDSLKSCFRAGYRAFGTICVLPGFDRPVVLATPGCARAGFRLQAYPFSPFGTP